MSKRRTLFFMMLIMLATSIGLCFTACKDTASSKRTLTFKNGEQNYEVALVDDGGTATLPAEPTKNGYTFDGWFIDNGTWEAEFTADRKIEQDLNVYAKWSLVNYTITYRTEDDEVLTDVEDYGLPVTYTIESDTFTLNSYYRPGYLFERWVSEDGIPVSSVLKGTYGNLVLYLNEKPAETSNIYYVDTLFGLTNDSNPDSYEVGGDSPEFFPLSKLDYNFLGWTLWDGIITEIDTSLGGDVTLYAVWEQKPEYAPFSYIVSENDDWCILTGVNDPFVTELVIPDVFDMIAPGALKYCRSLEELTLSRLSALKDESSNGYLGYLFGYDNYDGNKNVPSALKKVSVQSGELSEYAFAYCENLEEINVSADVSAIGENAYLECKSLKTLTTPIYLDGKASAYSSNYYTAFHYGIHGSYDGKSSKTLTSYGDLTLNVNGGDIGAYAFRKNTSIKTLNVENVSKIGAYAFSTCTNLEAMEVEGVSEFGKLTFYNCTSLKSASLPEGMTALPESMFSGCTRLMSIKIPSTVESIADKAFSECFRLFEIYNFSDLQITKGGTDNGEIGKYAFDIYTTETASKLADKNGLIYRIDGNEKIALKYYGTAENVTLEDGTYRIYREAFKDTGVKSVTFPDGLTTIDDNAFENTQLTAVNLPSSVTSIGKYAFANNSSLTAIDISKCGITELSEGIFYNCTGFYEITIPDSVTKIQYRAFAKCAQLGKSNNGSITPVVLSTNITYIGSEAFGWCDSLKEITVPFIGSGEDGSTNFSHIFGGTLGSLNKVNVLSGERIANNAFEGFSGLQVVNMPTATEIGEAAFKNCSSLNTVIYSEDIKKIGKNAFENTNLNEVRLPCFGSGAEGETAVLGYIFGGTNGSVPRSLNKVTFTEGITTIPASAFDGCNGINEIVLSQSVTIIKERAFAGTSLTEMVLDERFTEIGFGAFSGCDSMTSITLPFMGDGTTGEEAKTHFGYVFGANTKEDHHALSGARAVPATLKNVTILGGKIATDSFYKCDRIETITFGANVTEITGDAFTFAGDINLDSRYDIIGRYWDRYEHVFSSFEVVQSNNYFKSSEGILYSKDGKKLVAYPATKSGESFTVPAGVEEIGTYAFYTQRNLKHIGFGDDTQIVSYWAFAGCGELKTFEFGTKGALKELGGNIFARCGSLNTLDELVIPEGVTKIGNHSLIWVPMIRVVLPSTLEWIGYNGIADENSALQKAKFNTTHDWELPSWLANRSGSISKEISATTLADETEAAIQLIKSGGELTRYTWVKKGYFDTQS